ncbi:50S ribosomal protein L24 [Candidatus Micrarchaeota archaeon]|nr:50S ribosomal protein L24 [Candidatus Micrarchaeota archaeon]
MNCSFCSKSTSPGRGFLLYNKDGSSKYFCSRKCFSNFKMNRKPARLKWTK